MKNIKIDDFTKYTFLSGVNYAPNGENACFVLNKMDVDENKYISNLWLYNEKNEKYFQLTSFDKESNFVWLQDNENILFPGMRDTKDKEKLENGEEFTQFYRINIHGGEAKKEFSIPKRVNDIKQIDKDTFIFTATVNINKKDINLLTDEEKSKELKRIKEDKDYEVLEEIPFWSNGGGFTNKDRNRLYIFHKDTKKIDTITEGYMNVSAFDLDKDNKRVVFSGGIFKDKLKLSNSIYLLDLESKNIVKLTEDDCNYYADAKFILQDKIILLGSSMKKYGLNENSKFYTININTKEMVLLTPELDKAIGNSVGSDCRYGGGETVIMDGKYIYFTTTEMDSSYLNKIDINGNISRVIENTGSIDSYSVNNGNILFIGLRDMKLQELYAFKNGEENQISRFNEWVEKDRKIVVTEPLNFESEPGVVINGWVLKPADYVEGKKYPAIYDIHGGPKTVYGPVFFHEMQYFASQGYFVFFCNPRGSDGKGNEFADIRGKYGTIDFDDLMRFMDKVLEKYPEIDGERVGVTGGSYGGFMTNWIIGHTDRFKAAASQRSISNWVSKFCTTDIGYFFVDDQNAGATPWSDVEKLWNNSPLKYADRVKTPTLFLHSEEDYRCWLAEGIQMYTALKYHGVESRLIMFRGENHELSRSGKPKHRIRRLNEIINWFDKYVKNGSVPEV